MKRLSLLAIPAALLLAGTVSAHSVTPACGSVTFDSSIGWTATFGNLTFGPFTVNGDNGPYKVAAGTYTFTFEDTTGKPQETGSVTVPPCATPTPSVTPKPKPTPHATPPVTSTSLAPAVRDDFWATCIVYLAAIFGLASTCWRFVRRIR